MRIREGHQQVTQGSSEAKKKEKTEAAHAGKVQRVGARAGGKANGPGAEGNERSRASQVLRGPCGKEEGPIGLGLQCAWQLVLSLLGLLRLGLLACCGGPLLWQLLWALFWAEN